MSLKLIISMSGCPGRELAVSLTGETKISVLYTTDMYVYRE